MINYNVMTKKEILLNYKKVYHTTSWSKWLCIQKTHLYPPDNDPDTFGNEYDQKFICLSVPNFKYKWKNLYENNSSEDYVVLEIDVNDLENEYIDYDISNSEYDNLTLSQKTDFDFVLSKIGDFAYKKPIPFDKITVNEIISKSN